MCTVFTTKKNKYSIRAVFIFRIVTKAMATTKKKGSKNKSKKKVSVKNKKNQRRNIRKIMKNADLSQLSKLAIENERARKKRCCEKEKIVCILRFIFRILFRHVFHKICFSYSLKKLKRNLLKMNSYSTSKFHLSKI